MCHLFKKKTKEIDSVNLISYEIKTKNRLLNFSDLFKLIVFCFLKITIANDNESVENN